WVTRRLPKPSKVTRRPKRHHELIHQREGTMKQAATDCVHRMVACAGVIAALTLGLVMTPVPILADDASDAKGLIDQAENTLKNFMNDPDMKWFGKHLQEAKGVYIVPKLTKGAFIFGVEGGNGVVLARDEKGGWSEPVFYETSAASFGLQAGAQSQEAILLIMTPNAVASAFADTSTLG